MELARTLGPLAAAALVAGCSTTPDAADLVEQRWSGRPRVSEAEAAAALLDYVGAVNRALRTGDTDDLAARTGPQCPCRHLVALIEERFADGARLDGAAFDAGPVTVLDRRGGWARVRARVSVSAYDVRSRDGLVVGSRPAQEYVATYTVQMRDEAWQVVDVREAS